MLAADVVELELRLSRSEQELRIVREMLSETLDITFQALAHIATKARS